MKVEIKLLLKQALISVWTMVANAEWHLSETRAKRGMAITPGSRVGVGVEGSDFPYRDFGSSC